MLVIPGIAHRDEMPTPQLKGGMLVPSISRLWQILYQNETLSRRERDQ